MYIEKAQSSKYTCVNYMLRKISLVTNYRSNNLISTVCTMSYMNLSHI
jgi:hypothetical protein